MVLLLSILMSVLGFIGEENNSIEQSDLKYAVVNGTTKIAYVEAGKGKVTNLMVHGLAGSHEHFIPLIEEMSKNARCIAIDLPGYGASSKSIDHNQNVLEYFSDVIVEFIKVNKLKQVNLIGHSMGGQISIITALNHPEVIERLTLLDPAGFETFSEKEKELLRATATSDYYKNMTDDQVRFAFDLNFSNMPSSVEELIEKRMTMRDEEGFDAYCSLIASGVDGMLGHEVKADLKNITITTLVLFAEQDKLIPNKYLHPQLSTKEVADIANDIPGSKLVMIPEAGHMVQYEKPLEVSNQILDFINKN